MGVRDAVNLTMDGARNGKLVGSPLEAAVTLHVPDAGLAQWLQGLDSSGNGADELRYLLIVSSVGIADSANAAQAADVYKCVDSSSSTSANGGAGGNTGGSGSMQVHVGVSRAAGSKCARCWNYSTHVGSAQPEHPELCERCGPIVVDYGFQLPMPAAAMPASALG